MMGEVEMKQVMTIGLVQLAHQKNDRGSDQLSSLHFDARGVELQSIRARFSVENCDASSRYV